MRYSRPEVDSSGLFWLCDAQSVDWRIAGRTLAAVCHSTSQQKLAGGQATASAQRRYAVQHVRGTDDEASLVPVADTDPVTGVAKRNTEAMRLRLEPRPVQPAPFSSEPGPTSTFQVRRNILVWQGLQGLLNLIYYINVLITVDP